MHPTKVLIKRYIIIIILCFSFQRFLEYSLVAFTERREFWVVAPGRELLLPCVTREFFCDKISIVSTDNWFFQIFSPTDECGDIPMDFFLGIECIPGMSQKQK